MSTARRFLTTLEKAQEFFQAEPAAVSLELAEFGTIARDQVDHLITLARVAVIREKLLARVGELCRDGVPVFYAVLQDGTVLEGASQAAVVDQLMAGVI